MKIRKNQVPDLRGPIKGGLENLLIGISDHIKVLFVFVFENLDHMQNQRDH